MEIDQHDVAAVADRFRAAMREGAATRLGAVLDDDVTFYSPAFAEPSAGRGTVATILATASGVYGDLAFEQQLVAGPTAVLFFEADVAGLHLHGCYRLTVSERGTIASIEALMRPVDAVQALVTTMMSRLAASDTA